MVGNIAMVLHVIARDRLNSADALLTSRHFFFFNASRSGHLRCYLLLCDHLQISLRPMTVI